MDFLLTWQFKNGHTYTKDFATPNERDTFMNSVGLIAHSDIVKVIASYPETSIKSIVLKDVVITKQLAEADTIGISYEAANAVPNSRFDHMAIDNESIPAFTPDTMPKIDLLNTPSYIPTNLRVV